MDKGEKFLSTFYMLVFIFLQV